MTTNEAQERLEELLDLAAGGEEIRITLDGAPVARLVAISEVPERRLGEDRDRVGIAHDFDVAQSQEILSLFLDE